MHIGLVSDQYPPYPVGGVGARITDLAHGLVANGHKVTVIGVYPRNRGIRQLLDETLDDVRVIRLPPAPRWMRWRPGLLWERYLLCTTLGRLNKQSPFDLVEFTDGFGWAFFGAPRGVVAAIRIEGSTRFYDAAMGIEADQFTYWMEGISLRKSDCLSAVSAFAKTETLRIFGLNQKPCTVIHNAVDTGLFQPGQDAPDPGLIVFANSIEPRKGALEMVTAMNDICAVHSHARLVMIGSDTQPQIKGETYSGHIMDSVMPEYRDRITFTGRLDRNPGVLEYLQRAAVCCYPSRVETFGIAPLEAMAVAKPVIYCNTGPGPELIEDGVSGFLCDCTSARAIAATVNQILNNPDLAAAVGRRARERVLASFDKRAWIRRNIAYYRSSIDSFRKRRE